MRLSPAICQPLLTWFSENARVLPWRKNRDPYRVWVSEIMLQQTRVEAVKAYFLRFMETLPTVQDLAAAEEQTYLKLWEGLGYYSRVRNLHKAAVQVCTEYGGQIPATHAELLKLAGIGDYTAGAVASIAFGEKVPAVDGNVLRVVARLTADERPVTDPKVKADMRAQLVDILPDDVGAFNQALMEIGAMVCIPNGAPKCEDCPLLHLCAGAHMGIAARLPNKAAKKARTIVPRTIFLLRYDGKIALHRRPAKGLLAKLWELPGAEEALSPEDAKHWLSAQSVSAAKLLAMRPAKHIFTHVEWHMTGYYVTLSAQPPANDWVWVTPAQLREAYALPSAFRAFLRAIEEEI